VSSTLFTSDAADEVQEAAPAPARI